MYSSTMYKKPIRSPYQATQKKSFSVQNSHPAVKDEIKKNVGSFVFTAVFEEDIQTLALFKHIKGLIAFICTLKGKNNEVIGQGRGTAVLSKINKYVEKTIRYAFNSALLDAIAKATKSLDALQIETNQKEDIDASEDVFPIEEIHEPKVNNTGDMATEKQKNYLLELIKTNVADDNDRNELAGKVESFSKSEASETIQELKNKYLSN